MAKGGDFENFAGRLLSSYLTAGEDLTQFVRTESSGGWARRKTAKQQHRQLGDLAANGPQAEIFRRFFSIECKHRKSINLWHHWTCQPSDENIHGWWAKAMEETEDVSPRPAPFLLFRMNRMPITVGIPERVFPFQLHARTRTQVLFPEGIVLLEFEDFARLPVDRYYKGVEAWRKFN